MQLQLLEWIARFHHTFPVTFTPSSKALPTLRGRTSSRPRESTSFAEFSFGQSSLQLTNKFSQWLQLILKLCLQKYLGWASWCWHLVESPCHLRSSWGPFALRPPPTTSSQGVLRTEHVIKSQIVWILHDFGVSQNVDLWIAASITITSKLIKFDVTCISTCERLQRRHLELWQFCPGSLHQLHCGVAWDMQLLMVSIQLCHQFVLNLQAPSAVPCFGCWEPRRCRSIFAHILHNLFQPASATWDIYQSFKGCGFHASGNIARMASLWVSGSQRAGNVTGVAALGVTLSGYAGMSVVRAKAGATGSAGISDPAGQRRGAK